MKRIFTYLVMTLCVLGVQAQELMHLPSIPTTITAPRQRAAYLVEHYWDDCTLNDAAVSHKNIGQFEQFFVDFAYILPHANADAQALGIKNLLEKASASKSVYKQLVDWSEKYLYDLDSPVYNESHFIIFLQGFIDSQVLNSSEKARPQALLEYAKKNCVGSIATDFKFTTRNDIRTSLKENLGKEQTLVIFYDSECDHCYEVIDQLKTSTSLSTKADQGLIKILSICVSGAHTAWMSQCENIPETWIAGYADSEFDESELYTIRSVPALYLLDADGRVILKDAKIKELSKE